MSEAGTSSSTRARAVDVVIPVYNAAEDLARCVDSVLACTDVAYRLIIIDDASPDPAIGRYLAALERRALPQVVLLHNDANLGFTATANRGMRHGAPERADVVLLNSDTVVTRGWLDAMLRCAWSSPHIGTVTPFSNNAEICSLPRFCENNDWPEGADPEPLAEALARAAVPTWPELPTGVGFCMLISRALIEGIGYLDEAAFGKGYGEENDYCLRGFRAGYRNALCDDAFVLHLGARSFAGSKAELSAANLAVLQALHPHYDALVRDFIARDPLRPLRTAALAQWRCASGPALGVLHVIHGHGGGTEHHARALIDATRQRCRHYLAIVVGSTWQVEEHLDDGGMRSFALTRERGEALQELLGAICATFRIGLVHLHNVSGCRDGLAESLQGLRLQWGYTVHDLSFACPTITFHGQDGLYCGGETDAATCQACLGAQPEFAHVDIVAWRTCHRALVAGAAFLIAPSRWAADMLGRYFPGAAVDVIPHGAPGVWATQTSPKNAADAAPAALPLSGVLLPDDGVPTVAVIGAIGPDKGARRLERLVDLARATGVRVRFVVIGYLDVQSGPWQSPDAMLTVHGRYAPRDLPALFAHYRVRLVAYPSAGPETFSFTLSEAWAAGCPVLVPPFGALVERVGATGAGFVLTESEWRSEAAMLARLAAVLRDEDALDAVSRAALAVEQPTLRAMAERTFAHYLALGNAGPPACPPLAPERVRDALGYALWWPPEPAPLATDTRAEAAVVAAPGADGRPELAPAPSRWRQSLPGRLLYRWLPERVITVLKARLR